MSLAGVFQKSIIFNQTLLSVIQKQDFESGYSHQVML